MKWAGSPANLGVQVLTALMAVNVEVSRKHGKPPLDAGEVSGVAKSVERYRARWIAAGRFYTEGERTAWGRERGIRSGVARRKRTEVRDREIVEAWLAGLSQRSLAAQHGVALSTVQHILARDLLLFLGVTDELHS